MAGTGEPTQHPSPHMLLHCGEILWPQRGLQTRNTVSLLECRTCPECSALVVRVRFWASNWTAKPLRRTHRVNIPVSCQLEEFRPRLAGHGRAGAFFVGDRLAHSNKIPLILPIV